MLTRIVQPAPALETFLDALRLDSSRPQRDHLLQLVDGLLVCDESKTVAALQRQFLDDPKKGWIAAPDCAPRRACAPGRGDRG